MVSNKNPKKARKPIETTLGKAPVKPKEQEADISHLRKPIETSISGIKQIISILETATSEVNSLLMFECDIMYECRICRTIFRSLANFLLHKRNYCKDRYSSLDYINNNDSFKMDVDTQETNIKSSSLGKVIQKLHEIDRVRQSAKQFLTADLSSEFGDDPVRNAAEHGEKLSNFNEIIIEKIDSNTSGIFQTLAKDISDISKENELMKTQVMELHKKVENDVPVLDAEGKICGFTSSRLHQTSLFPQSKFKCTECSHKFATQKSLTNHMKYIHNPSRIIYICPTCKDTFANPWCVYRHLLKVHRMSSKQVRRMREQVHNSWIRRGEESSIPKKKSSGASQIAGDSENQWINDIEGDNDFQMCAGCGKHFERKAALHSHSQMCAKRLEVCNNIKENAKKKCEDVAMEKAKLDKITDKVVLKGASKRKAQNVVSFRRKRSISSEVNEPIVKVQKDLSGKPNPCVKSENNISNSSPYVESALICNKHIKMETSSSDVSTKSEQILSQTEACKDGETVTEIKMKGIIKDLDEFPEKSSSLQSRLVGKNKKQISANLKHQSPTNKLSSNTNSGISKGLVNSFQPSSQQMPTLRSFEEDSIEIVNNPFSPDEVISHSKSSEDTIYLSSSDESQKDRLDMSPRSHDSEVPIKPDERDCGKSARMVSTSSIGQDSDNTVLLDRLNLLSNKVSFETFCKKVPIKKTNAKYKNSQGNITSLLAKRKRNLSTDNQDDVIFVSETISKSGTSKGLENGFAGFSSEETNKNSFSVDFSKLSYNNPLKSKTKDAAATSHTIIDNVPQQGNYETKDISVKNKIIPKDVMNENFLPRAEPYMNREQLLCIPCGITFKSFSSLLWHMSAHFSWFRVQCSKCSFITFNKYDCMVHVRKDHHLKGQVASSYILPLPNWKTVLMSHEFRLLTDSNDLKGKHTDEKIGIDENEEHDSEKSDQILDPNVDMFFGENSVSKDSTSFAVEAPFIVEKDDAKRGKIDKGVIDIQETIEDCQKLPEPVELTMPADVSEVFRTLTSDEGTLSPEDTMESLDHCDESNDDWGLSKVCESEEPVKSETTAIGNGNHEEAGKTENLPINIRSSRIRTKVKQNADFLYYDNDVNSVLKVSELFKTGGQKSRSDNPVSVKPKCSSKSVTSPLKKKS